MYICGYRNNAFSSGQAFSKLILKNFFLRNFVDLFPAILDVFLFRGMAPSGSFVLQKVFQLQWVLNRPF